MQDWNPLLYSRFEAQRTRPARDLLAAVPIVAGADVRLAYDLGCGPGNSTQLLHERFDRAEIVGVDNSSAMLANARTRLPKGRFESANIATWVPEAPPDLIYANASLQWLPDHERLIPRLFAFLQEDGVFAFQMPDNLDEATHRLMREVAADPRWSAKIGPAETLRSRPLPLSTYYDLLAPMATQVDVWRTTYFHPMRGPADIVEWLRSTGLKPFIDPLDEPLRTQFLSEYEARLATSYAPQTDGQWLLPFPRIFVVATRRRLLSTVHEKTMATASPPGGE